MVKSLKTIFCLLLLLVASRSGFSQSVDQMEAHIRQLQQTVQNRRHLVSELRPDRPLLLPVGIGSLHSNQPPILIDDLVLYPDHAEFRAYAVLQLPGAQDPIYFATAEPVTLSFKGGISGTARMELVNDKELPMGVGDATLFLRRGDSFIEFGCNGFLQAGLGVEVTLPSKLVKENRDGTQNLSERIKGRFSTVFSDPNNILGAISIEPFQVKGISGLSFEVKDAVVDLSDNANSLNMVFPKGYLKEYLEDVDAELWRGIYLKNVSVRLPQELRDRSAAGRKEIGVRNLLIDGQGLSGEIFAQNVIKIENGDLGGWAYSVDAMAIGLSAGQLQYAKLSGGLSLPIAEKTTLDYSCVFNPGQEYLFNVKTTDKLAFNIFQAGEVVLDRGSKVEVALVDKKFEAEAKLSGRMIITAGLGKADEQKSVSSFKLADIRFEELALSSKAPYLHSGYFNAGAEVRIGSFEGSVSNIRLIKKDDSRGLGFDLKIGLLKSEDATSSFAADASLTVLGTVREERGRQKYAHSSTDFTRITIDVDQGAFKFFGNLNFFSESQAFGEGFKGQIAATIKPGIEVGATALFGKVNGLNYWYADAAAGFPGIPVAPAVEIDGFAGGVYYGVQQKPGSTESIAVVNSQTGLSYLPDHNAGLGIRAAVRFGMKEKKDVFNGNLGFEVVFNKSGGIGKVLFMGNANFLQEPEQNTSKDLIGGAKAFASTAPGGTNHTSAFDQMNKRGDLSAQVLIDMDLNNNSLFANVRAFINVADGQLRGVSAGGLAGEGVLYFGPDTWFIHLGTPSVPIGIELAGIARASAYFMVGKDLPGSPPPPKNVSEILGGKNLDYMRDLNALASGRGLAFGAGLNFDTGNLTFLVFYARFAAGAGFDVMLKDYGNQATSNGKPLGIRGWYANGQVYAYLQGKIGILVSLFGSTKRFDIIDLGAATVLQAKLPNPTWMHGVVGGHYRILGGMIKGSCRFEFTLGKEPNLAGTDVFANSGVKVIAEVSPENSEKDVDVFAIPQVLFNIPIGESFSISDPTGRNVQFRARLEEFSVKEAGRSIAGALEWNADKTVLAFNPAEILPGNRAITINAKVVFEEYHGGSWRPYILNGVPYIEKAASTFTSGVPPDHIPASNIAYSYPVAGQLNYYRNESRSGYIKLKRGQAYLFAPDNPTKQIGRLRGSSGTLAEFDVSYQNNEVRFSMPSSIKNDEGYQLMIVAVPRSVNAAIDRNVQTEERQVSVAGLTDISISTRQTTGLLNAVEESETFRMSFRSSRYSRLQDKLRDATNSYSTVWPLRNAVDQLWYVLTTDEMFDAFETATVSPLIRLEADLTENFWYQNDIHPYLYRNYETSALKVGWRDTKTLGAPPILAVSLSNRAGNADLKYAPERPHGVSGTSSFVYNLPHFIERDYHEIQTRAANAYAYGDKSSLSAETKAILEKAFSPIRRGSYVIKVAYVLPGSDTVTSLNHLSIYNEIGY